MSGICAAWRREDLERITETLGSVSSGLASLAEGRIERKHDRGAGVAVSARTSGQQIYQSARLLIACDAELQNEDELRREMGAAEPAAENAKTAALLGALYERFGSAFPEKLRGGFSVVLWDRRERRLLAAIDDFGIKRLVYYQDSRILLIASRIDALARSGDVDTAINPRAIANLLNFSANLGPETILAKVSRLAPGTVLLASDQDTRFEKYWDMRYGVGDDRDEGRLSRKLEAVVEQAVANNCKGESLSDVGAFLSGGTDSSTVVGMMSRLDRGSVKAFSIGFQEQPFNELSYAEIAAKKFHAEHYTYLVGADDCFEALPDMVRSFDEPFGNSSAIPTYFCARLAAQHGVKALLAGDGGDELFAGNEWYATDKLYEMYQVVPRVLRRAFIEPAVKWLPIGGALGRKSRNYVSRANMTGIQRTLSTQFLATHPPSSVFESDFLQTLKDYSIFDVPSRHYAQAQARDHLDRMLYVDVKITLADSDLPKVTSMCDLAGIQARFPFLDRTVAEFSGRIPAGLKIKGFEKRYLFKKAFQNLLPQEIIQKKKHGFGIPVATWLKSDRRLREFSRDILLSRRACERGYFQRDFTEKLIRLHEGDDSTYYGDTLWTFFVLELWHRQFVDEPMRVVA